MSGGGQQPATQQTSQTQNTTSTSAPPPVLQPYLNSILGQLPGFSSGSLVPPSLYSGPMVAPPSTATQAGWQTLAQIGAGGAPVTNALNGFIGDTVGGKFLDPGRNPYLQQYLKAGFDQQNQSFNDVLAPNLRAQFENTGRNLGGSDEGTVLRAVKDMQTGQATAAAGAEAGAYGQERGNQFTAANLAPTVQNMEYQNANAIGQAGAGIDAYNQAATNEAMYRDQYAKTGGLDWLMKLAQMAQGIYPGGTTQGTGTSTGFSTGMPASNPAASDIGTVLSGLGTVAKFLPFIPFSDVRLKKNIRGPIGRTNAGHNLYRYEFLGSDRPEIGVLAQEVERKDPAAVVRHPSGYKMVDYNRAAPAGGLI